MRYTTLAFEQDGIWIVTNLNTLTLEEYIIIWDMFEGCYFS